MENSKNSDGAGTPSRDRASSRVTIDALLQVLTHDLALTPETPLYVAYSGGVDSHVLLHALVKVRARAPWPLHAIHIDHQLQPASSEWARHCERVCADLRVPCHVDHVQVNDIDRHGLEDAARRARYEAFMRLLPANAVLITAHHQDDQAETLLLQLLRGAGVHGLAAMPMSTRFGNGRLVRPLLGFRRDQLVAYAQAEGLKWIEDGSNSDLRMARNFLRSQVMPLLETRWPNAIASIARSARHQAEAAVLLDESAALDLRDAVNEAGELAVTKLRMLSAARQANLIRYWIRRHRVKVPSETVLREILARVQGNSQTQHAVIHWADAQIRRYRDRLVLTLPVLQAPAEWEVAWEPHMVLNVPGSDWKLRTRPGVGKGLARSRVEGKSVRVRLRRGGERCLLRGHHHKLKKLLQEAGVPPWERARMPLVFIDGNLAAVGDRWVCEPYGAQADEPSFMLVLEPNTR